MRTRLFLILVTIGALALLGCGDDPVGPSPDAGTDGAVLPDASPDAGPDLTEAVYDPDRILEVVIDLAPADWDALRGQTRTVMDIFAPGCLAAPFPDPFTYFPAAVTIDGSRFESVGVRKKGFLGSLSRVRPSLIVKLDELVAGQAFSGVDRLTLNNNQQDPSFIHQCLGYAVLAAAGVPAPRCSFAHVTVNGEDLGVFTSVEPIRKAFLERHFADGSGTLWEGTLSDFRPGWDQTFEQKTNEATPDRAPLDALSAALTVGDAELLPALDPLMDVDRFLTFWALEVLISHWDGYAGDANNFYVYDDPSTGQLSFLPWGIDATFVSPEGAPTSVMARGLLTRRLYLLPETRARYVARLLDLLDRVWPEDDLLAEVDRMEALITPLADPDGSSGLAAQVEQVRQFIGTRRATLLAELEPQPPQWTEPLRGSVCMRQVGTLDVTFSTTWDSLATGNPFGTSDATIVVAHESGTPTFTNEGELAGLDQDGRAALLSVGRLADGTLLFVILWLPPALVAPGAWPIDWVAIEGQVFVQPPAGQGDPYPVAFVSEGTLVLGEASTVAGAPVSGTLDAVLLYW